MREKEEIDKREKEEILFKEAELLNASSTPTITTLKGVVHSFNFSSIVMKSSTFIPHFSLEKNFKFIIYGFKLLKKIFKSHFELMLPHRKQQSQDEHKNIHTEELLTFIKDMSQKTRRLSSNIVVSGIRIY